MTLYLKLFTLLCMLTTVVNSLDYKEMYFEQSLDHLNSFYPMDTKWQHRYLLNDDFFSATKKPLSESCPGPILLYTGNEGDITAFWKGSGFMHNLAEKWGGLLLFPEQRYYGKSIPSDDLKYLNTQQVLEDFVAIVSYIKDKYSANKCPVIAFGGSYGGTLTTFMRAAYPHIIIGGLAASAPVGYYDVHDWETHGVNEYTFSDIITRSYDNSHPRCLEAIWAATDAIDNADPSDLISSFNLCKETALQPTPSSMFLYGLEGLCQQNYPQGTADLPAWPVNHVCDILVDALVKNSNLIEAAAKVTGLTLGYELDSDICFETLPEGPGNVPGDGPGLGMWGYQSCTETMHKFSSKGKVEGGLRDFKFDFKIHGEDMCLKTYGLVPNTQRLTERYGGYKIGDGETGITNMIWTSGDLDPWSGGCFKPEHAPSDATERNLYYFVMPNGAHHVDLRAPHETDPVDITYVRSREEEILWGWITDHVAKTAVDEEEEKMGHEQQEEDETVVVVLLR